MKEENIIEDKLQKMNDLTNRFDNTLGTFSTISGDVTQMTQIVSDLKRDIALMDHQLEAFIAEKHYNLEKFREVVPVIERQLDKVSDRMDNITMQVINCRLSSMNTEDIRQRELLINMLTQQSENFNNMIVKLLSI